jgi:hypothetical protein
MTKPARSGLLSRILHADAPPDRYAHAWAESESLLGFADRSLTPRARLHAQWLASSARALRDPVIVRFPDRR